MSRISKFVKNPYQLYNLEKVLLKHYNKILTIYKYLGAISASGSTLKVTPKVLRNYFAKTGIIEADGIDFKLTDFDLAYISTNSNANSVRSVNIYRHRNLLFLLSQIYLHVSYWQWSHLLNLNKFSLNLFMVLLSYFFFSSLTYFSFCVIEEGIRS